jgi:transposase InsO family protein
VLTPATSSFPAGRLNFASSSLLAILQRVVCEIALRLVYVDLPLRISSKANARWSLDFVHDQFACRRRFRVLNIVDDVTRECLAAIPDTSISGRRVARELTMLIERRGKPGIIVSDNGAELTSNAVLAWSTDHKVE